MRIDRRQLAKHIGATALAGMASPLLAKTVPAGDAETAAVLPASSEFKVREYEICLNNARWHPISNGARQAVISYLDYKSRGIWREPDQVSQEQHDVKVAFAKLIHANPEEIAYVNSTTAGESLFVSALGFPEAGGNIVTDALHFEGSLYLYEALRKQGMDVRVVRPRDWGISTADMEKSVDKNTRLVAVSHVSFINGFEHDMKAVCELAHAHGALVYADAVQAAGVVPINVQESGVDAMGCASYKWLMGDMGLGFLYVRQNILSRIRHTQFGYRQLTDLQYHVFPWDKPGTYPIEYTERNDAAGRFEIGTYDNATIAALSYSLPYIERLGVERIQAHAQSLLAPLRKELPRLGYPCITPTESASSIASFLVPDVMKTAAALRKAHLDVSLSPGRMRVSPSIYNDHTDIEKLLAALQ